MAITVIPYKSLHWAELLHNSTKRWNVLVLHRRAGKTTASLNHLQRDALRKPNSRYAYIAPTYKMAKFVAWDMIKKYSIMIPGVKYNEVELTVKYPNGSKLTLFGAEDPGRLRGLGFNGVALDEYSQQPPNIFSEVISKTLADNLGYAIWLGTPMGKNEFYRIYEESKNNPDFLSVFRTIDDTLKNEEGEMIENLRLALEDDRKLVAQNLITEDEFQQEWYNSFEAAIKGSYYSKELAIARVRGRIKIIPQDKQLLVHTAWDLGVGENIAVGFFQRISNELRLIDYWEGTNDEGITTAISIVKNKGYTYGKHFAPHDIEARELTTGKSRKETATSLGLEFSVVPKLSVDEGINAVRLIFPRLWIDEQKCKYFIDAISQYRREWDEKRGMFKEVPLHNWASHSADRLRYAALSENEMTNEMNVGRIMEIHKVREEYKSEWA